MRLVNFDSSIDRDLVSPRLRSFGETNFPHKRPTSLWCVLVFLFLCKSLPAEVISRTKAYQNLSPTRIHSNFEYDFNGINGRVLTGYQGWFRAPGDGSQLGFTHYQKKGKFEPGNCSIDLWPDLTEFSEGEKFATPFRFADGSVAHVFSSLHPETVHRHFLWMRQYEIDGAFVQRFALHGAKLRKNNRRLKYENQKLMLCRDSALRNGRCWALMYDLTGLKDEDFDLLAEDWKNLRKRMQLGSDPNDTSYLQFKGKPLVGIWGVGFNDNRDYTLEKTEWLIRFLKNNPKWGGMSIMLGIPYFWRELNRDAVSDARLLRLLNLADVLSPWSVGRYGNKPGDSDQIVKRQIEDRKWCERRKIHYLPVLFPGFSWKNMKGPDSVQIPRRKGTFLSDQFHATSRAGNSSAYLAMFDELDEGTAIFKCSDQVPTGQSKFVSMEGMPADLYLRIAQQGASLFRKNIQDH